MRNLLLATMLSVSTIRSEESMEAPNPYVRKPRNAAVSLEIGMNSLASMAGVTGTFFVQPRVAVDVGLGVLSTTGIRPGVRARYLFSDAKFSGFGYGGFKYGLGTGGSSIEIEDQETGETFEVEIDPSPFIDLGLGVDYLAHNGFYFIGTIGWSVLMGGKNYEWTQGVPRDEFDKGMALVLGSGPAL
jgi:hypothetical protein